MRPGLDLIVVNYRTPNDLENFLISLKHNIPTIPFSLVVVNVCPSETDREVAFKGTIPFDYKEYEENVGYARAVNYAATFGDRETIAIFNADTRLLDTVATDCHNALQSHPEWGILGPRQVDNEGRITHGGFFPQERGFHHRNSDQYGDIRDDATTVSGSAYFIKRQVWEELSECPIYRKSNPEAQGAFLPTQHYWEETWCSFHARAHGHKVVYYGPATMIHQWHRASRRGGHADQQIPHSKAMFQKACEAHGIQP